MRVPFVKMNGLGNDFIIFDARHQKIELSTSEIKRLSNRKNIGCDQLVVLEKSNKADCLMIIYNSDGSMSGACGNATRCVASILFAETKSNEVNIETATGVLNCRQNQDNLISVNMGIPSFDWQKIPLQIESNSQKILLHNFEFSCVNVENLNALLFLKNQFLIKNFLMLVPKLKMIKFFLKKLT